MSPLVVDVSREQLLNRRQSVLARIHLSEAELRAKSETGVLSGDEWEALEVLDRIAYLLDETA